MFTILSITTAFSKELYFSIVVFLSFMLSGSSRAFTAFLFSQLEAPESTIKLTKEELSWLGSIPFLFNPLGCLASGILMDLIGRKLCTQIIYVTYVISFLILGSAKSVLVLYISMFVSGISSGMSFCVATYVSEIALAEHRGYLLSFAQVTYSIGILLCNVLMYFFPWNIVSYMFAVFSFVALVLSLTLPESPIWLLVCSRREKSIETLSSLRCKEVAQLEREIREMEKMRELLRSRTLRNALKTIKDTWKVFTIVTVLFILCISTGYIIFISYTVMVVDQLDIPYDSFKVAIVYSTICCVATFATPFTTHKCRRKTLIATSAGGMGISMSVVALYRTFFNGGDKPYVWIVPVALYAYVFCCMIGVFVITFIVGGELFPREVAGILNGIYGSIGYIVAGMYSKIFPSFLVHYGVNVCLWAFAAFCFATCLYGILFVPETKGKSLNEIREKYFLKNRTDSTRVFTVDN